MKPDFKKMSRQELRQYILAHREDEEAIEELFVNRRSLDAIRFPYPYELSPEERKAIELSFQKLIEKKDSIE